jgi:hypothetical protein
MAMRRYKSPDFPGDIKKDLQPAEGDPGGDYGYGRHAHVPDPEAEYGFHPDETRVLPRDRKIRWKVSG